MSDDDGQIQRENVFDLYSHLKCNIKSTLLNCEIHDSEFNSYCFQCKRSICEVCVQAFHSTHSNVIKSKIGMEKEHIEMIFTPLEQKVRKLTSFSQPEKIKQDLRANVNKEIQSLLDKIEIYRLLKLKEIEDTFRHSASEANLLLNTIKEAKTRLSEFMLEHRGFLRGPSISDEDNFIFLINYDLINEGINNGYDYTECLAEIDKYYMNSACMEKNSLRELMNLIDAKIQDERIKAEIQAKIIEDTTIEHQEPKSKSISLNDVNCGKGQANPSIKPVARRQSVKVSKFEEMYFSRKEMQKQFYQSMEKISDNKYKEIKNKTDMLKDFVSTFKEDVFQNFKKHGSMVEIEKLVKMFEEKSNKRMNYNGKNGLIFGNSTASTKSGLTRSKATIATVKKENASEEKSKPDKKEAVNLTNKTNLFSLDEREEIDNDSDYEERRLNSVSDDEDSIDHLNMKTNEDEIEVKIENNIKMSDSKIRKREKMFKPIPRLYKRKGVAGIVDKNSRCKNQNPSNDLFKVNYKLLDLIKENQRLTSLIKSKEDITLQISTIRRYFAFSLLEYVRKNFKLSNKLESHLFLNESKQEETSTSGYVRIKEGGQRIMVYDRERMKKTVMSVKFNKKTHGIDYFPVGCRYYYHMDRVYITGGKVNNECINSVFCFVVREKKLMKMASMNNARAYHAIIFHENLKSLMVFGGEDNATCEMYDFFLNAWTSISPLNVPRANVSVHIDRLGTYAYTMCGITGSITEGKYSDTVEFLDLVDMNQGWAKVDYKNKAEVDLKAGEIKFMPFNEDKLVVYGGNESRKFHRCYCLFDLKKFEITKLDKSSLEILKAKLMISPEENN